MNPNPSKSKPDYKLVKNYFKKIFEIPEDWQYVQYRDVLTEVESPIDFSDDEFYHLITVKRRNEGLVLRNTLQGKEIETKNLFSVESGDFIIAKMQIIHGACGLVPPSLAHAKISGSYLRFKSKEILDLEYFNHFSKTPLFYQHTLISSVGSNLEKMNFNKKHWLNHFFPLPPLKQQQKISLILLNIDSIIQQIQHVVDQTQKLKKGLMQELLTKGITHSDFRKPKLDTISQNWLFSTIGEHCEVGSGGTPNREKQEYYDGTIPWVKTTEIKYNTIMHTEESITELALKESSAKKYPKRTVLLAMYGQGITRGKCAILGIDAAINQACAAIQTRDNIIPEFLFIWLQTQYEKIRNLSHGSHQSNLNLNLVKNMKIPILSINEQQKIVSIISNNDSLIQKQQEYKSKLETLKKGLMQKLFTGQIRVKI